MFSLVSGITSVALYALSAVILVQRLHQARTSPSTAVLAVSVIALALHASVLHNQLLTPEGIQLGFFYSLSLAAAVMVVLMMLIGITQPVQTLGLGVFPFAALAQAGALAAGGGPIITTDTPVMATHILISICAYGVLGLAAIQSLVLAFQHRMLHEHHALGAVRALPALSVMEKLLFHLIAIGFALLTIALATGLFFLDDIFAQQMVHKTVLSIFAWLLFAILLGGHWLAGWRSLTAVRLTLGGIALLVLGYSGSKLVVEIILQRSG